MKGSQKAPPTIKLGSIVQHTVTTLHHPYTSSLLQHTYTHYTLQYTPSIHLTLPHTTLHSPPQSLTIYNWYLTVCTNFIAQCCLIHRHSLGVCTYFPHTHKVWQYTINYLKNIVPLSGGFSSPCPCNLKWVLPKDLIFQKRKNFKQWTYPRNNTWICSLSFKWNIWGNNV